MVMTEQQIAKGLMQAGRLTAQQIESAVKSRRSGASFTQMVVELGYVTADEIRAIHPASCEALPLKGLPNASGAAHGKSSNVVANGFSLLPEDAAEILASTPVQHSVKANVPASNGSQACGGVAVKKVHPVPSTGGHSSVSGNGRSMKTLGSDSAVADADLQPEAVPSQVIVENIGLGQDDVGFLDNSDVVYDGDDGMQDDSKGPTVRWCNELLKIAVQTRSSDMHLEPRPDGLLPRYRIDGHLRPGNLLPREFMAAVISRFKVLANLDIAENRMPQDGRFRAAVGGRLFDFRVSTLPSMHGEKVVLRLLDRSSLVTDLTRLGFATQDADCFEKMLKRSHGMILVTGPTGSGKTTTLYAALAAANDESKNVITVEDPVEYELEGVTQCKVQPGIGLTFAAQLRAILRQDPDVILVGEIRDGDTADIAIRAALTGHLVLSTLHTNSAVGAVTRLQDMGVPPFLIASSLSGVIAQRLVRMICRSCRYELPFDHPERMEAIERLNLPREMTLYEGEGCEQCTGTGMRGRLALVEVLEVDSIIRKAVMAREDAGDLRAKAMGSGMKTLWQDGLEKLGLGLTTGSELIRVLMGHDEE